MNDRAGRGGGKSNGGNPRGRAPAGRGAAVSTGKPGVRPRSAAARPAPVPRVDPHAARRLAAELVEAVLTRHRLFDDALTTIPARERYRHLEPRDRAFARLVAATTLRRLGEIEAVLARFIDRPLPAEQGFARALLATASAQLLFLQTPAYAAVSAAVEIARHDSSAGRYAKLANAVLRRVGEGGAGLLEGLDPVEANIPAWLLARWRAHYGETAAREIAQASLTEAALDLTVKNPGEAAPWAERLGGHLLATGSVRLASGGRIEELDGYSEGAWWVQDAAAALPARLLGEVAGLEVADLCAAPGGKTAELVAAGARVTAVDASHERIERLRANMARLDLTAEAVVADVRSWNPGRQFDAVLLDAPCSSTGTIRRHPDILRLERAEDLAGLLDTQAAMLANALQLVKPGGRLVYCVCSLEREEGAARIDAALAAAPGFARLPFLIASDGGLGASVTLAGAPLAGLEPEWIDADGALRTLPQHTPAGAGDLAGMDGFYAACLVRTAA
jgi:16S rRNA (cytosine967-C5)-methyltransferase